MLLSLLLLLGASVPHHRGDDSLVAALSGTPASRLVARLPAASGFERGVALLFLAVADTTPGRWSEPARSSLDSLYRASRTPLRTALLGTAEALRARDLRGNGLKAAYWLARSLRHLDAAVNARPDDVLPRIFRINSLVDVPKPFDVEERLARDAVFLRGTLRGDLKNANPAILTALAAVAWRQGRSNEARAMWESVVAREPDDSPHRLLAERKLGRLGR